MNKRITFSILTLLSASACSHGDVAPAKKETPGVTQPSIEAKMAAAQSGSSDVVEVKFGKDATKISPEDEKKLKSGFQEAQKDSHTVRAILAVWSDFEMPKGEQDLPKAAQKLADDRATALRGYLKTLDPEISTKVANMAEHPSKLKKFLKTETVRVRQAFETAGNENAKASRGIVIFLNDKK